MRSWSVVLILLIFLVNPQKSWPQDFSYLNGALNSYLLPKLYGSDFLLIFWLVLDFWLLRRQTRLENAARRGLSAWLLLFFLLSLIPATVISPVRPLALITFLRLVLFLLVAFRLSRRPLFDATAFRVGLLLTVTLVSVWSLGQSILQRPLFPFWTIGEARFSTLNLNAPLAKWAGVWRLRVSAGFPHPNVLAAFLAVFLLWLLSWAAAASSRRVKFVRGLVFFLGLLSLFLTFSQAAWFAFLAGLTITMVLKKKRSGLFWGVVFLGLLILGEKIAGLSLETMSNRRGVLTEAAWATMTRHPFTGGGLATSVFFAPINWAEPVHNLFLLVGSEAGFLSVFFLILIVLRSLWRNRPGRGGDVFFVALGQIIFLSFFDHYFWSFPQGALLFWWVLSLAAKD